MSKEHNHDHHDHDHDHEHHDHHLHDLSKSKNAKPYKVRLEGKDWDDALEKAFKNKSKDVEIKGFRKGKVPRDIYEKEFGRESLLLDAADIALPKGYELAIIEKDIMPVVQPSVDLSSIDNDHVEFTFYVITKPEIKIKNYKDLKVSKKTPKVTKEELEKEIEFLLDKYTELVVKEGPAEEGDTVVIDFEGFKDDVAFEGGKGENYPLELGSNTFIPGFEEQLVGKKANSKTTVKVSFPDDYHQEDLKGQAVEFKVEVKEVKEKQKRTLDEDFFEDLGLEGITDKKSLSEEVEKNIMVRKEEEVENEYFDDLMNKIIENTEVEVYEEVVHEEQHRLLGRFAEQLKMQGISLELYYQFTNSNEAMMFDQLKEEANKNVLYRYVLEEIQKLEKIVISEETVQTEAQTLADKYQMTLEEFLETFGGLDLIRYDLELKAVLDRIKELNKV